MHGASRPGRRRTDSDQPMQAGPVTDDSRVQTPMRGSHHKAGSPSTPNHDKRPPAGSLAATPEVTTTYAKPCMYLGSPGGDSSIAEDGLVSEELRNLLAPSGEVKGRKGSSKSVPTRPLSSVSTSAGPTPSPDGRVGSPPFTPSAAHAGGNGRTAAGSRALESSAQKTAGPKRQQDARKEGKQAPPSQIRKVFVGGIPQEMTQDDLFKVFSEYAPVKKAWLQRYRDATKVKAGAPHNHRGFGFVIFTDGSAVDQLLGPLEHSGKQKSCFIPLKDGKKLEVKRAVSSSDMPASGNDATMHEWETPKQTQKRSQHASNSAPAGVNNAAAPTPAMACTNQPPVADVQYPFQPQQSLPPLPDAFKSVEPQQTTVAPAPTMHATTQPCWQPLDPRVNPWMGHSPPSMMVASPVPTPAPTTWPANDCAGLPQQSMSPPPQTAVQQLVPAVAGVALAAPTAIRPSGILVSGQCGYSPQMTPMQPSASIAVWPGQMSQTPPPLPISPGTPAPMTCGSACGADPSASPQHLQPIAYNAWAPWAAAPGSPAPQHQQPQQFHQAMPQIQSFPNHMAWQPQPQQQQQQQQQSMHPNFLAVSAPQSAA
eukprot:TRINITY_DN11385_c0_g1_i1.p1 TRINITY_DN11385_c0_g1~~TRINITY_DN11385_c0_g1_i1.p1  ORF type:complete len:595 (+),score=133.86 TRINITY_DN11385_c0_g1_i1:173-1957(+)